MGARRNNEQLVSDVADGNLTHGKGYNRPVDRLMAGALGSPPLARAIIRLQSSARTMPDRSIRLNGMDVNATAAALKVWALANVSEARAMPDKGLDTVCVTVVYEKNRDGCMTCHGRREVRARDQPVIVCPKCSGSGKRVYTGEDRRWIFGREMTADEVKVFDECLSAYHHHKVMADQWTEEKRDDGYNDGHY